MKTYYSLSCNQEFNGLYDCPLSNKSSFFKTKTLDIGKYDKYNNCPGLCVFYVYNIPWGHSVWYNLYDSSVSWSHKEVNSLGASSIKSRTLRAWTNIKNFVMETLVGLLLSVLKREIQHIHPGAHNPQPSWPWSSYLCLFSSSLWSLKPTRRKRKQGVLWSEPTQTAKTPNLSSSRTEAPKPRTLTWRLIWKRTLWMEEQRL